MSSAELLQSGASSEDAPSSRRAWPLNGALEYGEAGLPPAAEERRFLAECLAEAAARGLSLGVLWFAPPSQDPNPSLLREDDGRRTAVSDFETLLLTCAQQQKSARHPVVLVSASALLSQWHEVRRLFAGSRLPITMVAVNDDEARGAWPDRPALADLRELPHVLGMVPRNPCEFTEMLSLSVALARPSIVVIRPALVRGGTFEEPTTLIPGACERLSAGGDLTLLAWGPDVDAAVAVARTLAPHGITSTVLSGRFFNPTDTAGIRSACRNTQCLVILEDELSSGGVGSAALESLAERGFSTPVRVLALRRGGSPPGGRDSIDRIAGQVRELLGRTAPGPRRISPLLRGDEKPCLASPADPRRAFSPEIARHERDLISRVGFSPDVHRWVSIYEKFGTRQRFLWQWSLHGIELTTLPSVLPDRRAHLNDTKLLSIMLCVFLDDVADRPGRDRLLGALLEAGFDGAVPERSDLPAAEQQYISATAQLWKEYQQRVETYPCVEVFRELLRYDLVQLFNTLQYSHLLNRQLRLLNLIEHDLYSPHNMMMVSFATLDLMCSPDFRIDELGRLREAMWHAQCMGRIGNLLSTWRRELQEGDFTSGVFARAVAEGDLSINDLLSADRTRIERAILDGGHEQHFFQRWEYHRNCLQASARRIESVELGPLLEGHVRFFSAYLGSQGRV